MKTLFNLIAGMLVILMMMSSCENENSNSREMDDFVESVAILQHGISTELKGLCTEDLIPLTVELMDFSNKIDLRQAYIIDDIEYCDNGLFNDEVANDGIYTSVEKFAIKDEPVKKVAATETTIYLSKSESFKYEDELERYVSKKKSIAKIVVKISCKFRTAPCPETSWWNECWFTDGPCTCIEFYDCEFIIEVESKN